MKSCSAQRRNGYERSVTGGSGAGFFLRFTKPKRRLFLERRQLFISQKRGSKSNVMPEGVRS
jgi:propanediol dehydratase large subunit